MVQSRLIRSIGAVTRLALGGFPLLPPLTASAQTASLPRTELSSPPRPQAASPAKRPRRRILTVFGQERLLPANIALDAAFRSALDADTRYDFEFFSEFMDAIRFGGPENEARFARYLKEKYADRPIDFLVAGGPQALEFLVKHRQTLFPNVPLVSAAIGADGIQKRHYPADIQHVPIHVDPVPTLEMALRLQPETQRLIAISGASAFDKEWGARMRRDFLPYERRIKIEYWSGWSLERMESKIECLPPQTIIFFASMFQDSEGRFTISQPVIERLGRKANAPLYGVYDTYLGHGSVGGYMDTFEALGRETARIVVATLSGQRAGRKAPPASAETRAYIVDWRQLQKWGMSESNRDCPIRTGSRPFWRRRANRTSRRT